MSTFNNVEKIKYTNNLNDVVSLLEYIVMTDDSKHEKYLIFKFKVV